MPWNHWLMDCVADLVASIFLPALKDKELLTAGFLEKLASRLNDLGEAINGASYGVIEIAYSIQSSRECEKP